MTLSLLLPWFPIVLAVGVGGRLLGRGHGLFMGVLCALFWVMLIQSSVGFEIWHDAWAAASIIAGCVAIAAMGCWSGETLDATGSPVQSVGSDVARLSAETPPDASSLQHISYAVDQFDEWLAQHRDNSDPWPKFGEFVRTTLYQCCKATHVRPYRLLGEGQQLVPLREPDPLAADGRISARRGIIGHVMTTGRSFVATDGSCGELVDRIAVKSPDSMAWCFAIKQGTRRIGSVTVGHLDIPPEQHGAFLQTMERLISQFWSQLIEVMASRTAMQIDPASGLLDRTAFLRVAEESIRASYAQSEPVAGVVFALEGLREINDSGRWEAADELVREVADTLRRKIRTDDRIGRFDGSRVVLLLRRVDSELASLIVSQIMARLTSMWANEPRGVTVRCGVAGSGTEEVDLRSLISRALAQCRRARIEGKAIASDLEDGDSTRVAQCAVEVVNSVVHGGADDED